MQVKKVLDLYFKGHLSRKKTDTPRIALLAIKELTKIYGRRQIATLTLDHAKVEDYTAKRKVSPATARRELGVLVAAANWCARRKLIAKADVPFVELPPASPIKDIVLTRAEALRLLGIAKAKSDRLYLYVAIALFTGARPSAVRYLPWQFVDLEKGIIDFRFMQKSGTSKKRYGVVRISPELRLILETAEKEKTSTWVLGDTTSLRKPFIAACKKAGLPSSVTPNTMRHTWASWAAADGVDLWAIAGVLGNSSRVVEQRYAHRHPDYQKAGMRRVFSEDELAALM